MQIRSFIKSHPISFLMIAATIAVVIALLAAPVDSASTNLCSPCHPGLLSTTYNQQLDIVEGNSQNQIPTNIQVRETQTVTIVIQNINDAARYNQLTNVALILSSQNGHFSVNTPTFNIATLSTGSSIATWQITGVSAGSDSLLISASAINTHNNLRFSDGYCSKSFNYYCFSPNSNPLPNRHPNPDTDSNTSSNRNPNSYTNSSNNTKPNPNAYSNYFSDCSCSIAYSNPKRNSNPHRNHDTCTQPNYKSYSNPKIISNNQLNSEHYIKNSG